jgi:hypothetical protein
MLKDKLFFMGEYNSPSRSIVYICWERSIQLGFTWNKTARLATRAGHLTGGHPIVLYLVSDPLILRKCTADILKEWIYAQSCTKYTSFQYVITSNHVCQHARKKFYSTIFPTICYVLYTRLYRGGLIDCLKQNAGYI